MSNGAPLVSAIIPTYGREPEYFLEAVESVAAQTHEPLELVVVDDSPEGVSERVEDREWPGLRAVRCLRDGDHDGVSAARNTGIEAAEGEFLAFLDDDDYWRERKLERQLSTFEAAGEHVGVVFSPMENVVDGVTASVSRPAALRGGPVVQDVTPALLSGESLCATSSVAVRASVVREHGVYFDEELDCWEDRDWYLRLSRHCAFATVDEPLVVKRGGDHEQLTDDFETIRDVAFPRFAEKHRPLAAEYGPAVERKFVAHLSLMLAGMAFANGEYGVARRNALRTVRHDPARTIAYLYLAASLGGRFTAGPLRALRRARA